MRKLEIGPGAERLPGFETLNAVPGPFTDHIGDARNPPFKPGTFSEVYSAHCIEHIEWHEVEAVIARWAKLLHSGGVLEIHTVDAVPMMQAMLDWEREGVTHRRPGKWKRELHRDHPFLAAQGRLLNYRKKGEHGHIWMHRAILTPRYLVECMQNAGLIGIERAAEPKGSKKHTGINMGFRGMKP